MAKSKISEKVEKLRNAGFNLGAAIDATEKSTVAGGSHQRFQNATLYWHPVMGKEAHEIHGSIRNKYIAMGGPDTNPATGRRDLGFPLSDEIRTEDGLYPVSYFEWGAIFWKQGGIALTGDFYTYWKNQKDPYGFSGLGYPVSERIAVDGGEVVFFEFGCLYKGTSWEKGVNKIRFMFPQIGLPAMIHPETGEGLKKTQVLRMTVGKWMEQAGGPDFFRKIFKNRLYLTETGVRNAAPAALQFNDQDFVMTDKILNVGQEDPIPMTDPNWPFTDKEHWHIVSPVALATGVKLKDRTLYDISVKLSSGEYFPLSRHCVYAKKSWDDFTLMHATDLHISERLEGIRNILRENGVKDNDLRQFNNCNDNFRDLIRYANDLHDAGKLDAILATGDLVDYGYEFFHDKKYGKGGNFAYFEKLICGYAPSADNWTPSEELRVPIFTTLGNHDYRENPYLLISNLNVTASDLAGSRFLGIPGTGFIDDAVNATVDAFKAGLEKAGEVIDDTIDWSKKIPFIGDVVAYLDDLIPDKEFDMSDSLNLTKEEAIKIAGIKVKDKAGNTKYKILTLEPEEAKKGYAFNEKLQKGEGYYFKRINRASSYTIPLGINRILMVDSKWDLGTPDSLLDAAMTSYLGTTTEAKENFIDVNPDNVGFDDGHVKQLKTILKETKGVVIVGVHAPMLNPKGNEFPPCFRETEHPAIDINGKDEISAYLRRRSAANNDEMLKAMHKGWFEAKGKPWFHSGSAGDMLDYGTSHGKIDDILKLCAGVDVPRKVDLVLSGHGHRRTEFRMEWDSAKKTLRYFMDFYSENPANYYRCKRLNANEPVQVKVRKDGTANSGVIQVRDQSEQGPFNNYLEMRVPPYPDSLDKAMDKKQWWAKHSPLMTQTAGVGPVESSQRNTKDRNKYRPNPIFQGCRLITIQGNIIQSMQYVGLNQIREKAQFKPPIVVVTTPK